MINKIRECIIEEYGNAVNFDRNIKDNSCEFYYYIFGVVTIIYIKPGIFGIMGMIVNKKYRNHGYGRYMWEIIKSKHKGTFILRSQLSGKFWEKLGFKHIGCNTYAYTNENNIEW